MRKIVIGAVALVSLLAGTPASAAEQPRRCDRAVQLDDRSNGTHARVCKGAHLTVVLPAPAADGPDTWWQPITADGRAVTLDPYHPRIVPARGVTVGFFRAAHHGAATLRSTRRICPVNPGGPTCHAMMSWRVEVDVR
jgi:hypothetical protein